MANCHRIFENQEKVYFGAWVTVEDKDGQEAIYRIIGPDKFDLRKNKLSMPPYPKRYRGKA